MNTNDYIRDGKGHAYRVGTLLGRGLYAKTYAVRGEDGKEWALKVPLNPSDLPKGQEKLAKISKQILQEQLKQLANLDHDELMLPKHQFVSQEGVYCVLYQRNDRTLYREMQRECSLQELLGVCTQIVEILTKLPAKLTAHGNLHPRNIFIGKMHNIQLSDPVTETLEEYFQSFQEASDQVSKFVPPELKTAESLNVRSNTTDSYSVAMLLYSSIMGKDTTQLSEDGLNKLLRSNLQARLLSLLEKDSSSNVRFRNRLASQLSRLLNRGLSPRYQPSPPFRFADLRELRARLQDLHDLIDPSITHVGKVIFNRPPGSSLFDTDESIEFSCSVETAPLLEDHQEIECGIMIFNRNKDLERIRGYECNYDVSRHPSGRLRFALSIINLPPSDYLLRLAFQIKGSIGEPYSIDSTFEVIPAPGYVPPPKEIPDKPLDISSRLSNLKDDHQAELSDIELPKRAKPAIVLPLHGHLHEDFDEESEGIDDLIEKHNFEDEDDVESTIEVTEDRPKENVEAKSKSQPAIVIKDPEDLEAPMEYDSEFDTDYPSAEESQEQSTPPVFYNPPVQNIPQKVVEKTVEDSPFQVNYEPLVEEPIIEEEPDSIEEESEEVEDSILGLLSSFLDKVKQDSVLTVATLLFGLILILLFVLFQLL